MFKKVSIDGLRGLRDVTIVGSEKVFIYQNILANILLI